ncbi:unnamed protein product, partial [Ectocarpus sp. 13 AM-2016]
MEDGIRSPAFSRSTSASEQASVDETRQEVKQIQEGIVLVHDARRFGVSERGLWHLDRLHSRAFQ